MSAGNLEAVCLAQRPAAHVSRVLRNALAHAPGGFSRFAQDAAALSSAASAGAFLRARLGFGGRVLRVERLEALARAALADGAPENCALVVAAGRGERADGALGAAAGRAVTLTRRQDYPHGLGPLWAAFGQYLAAEDPWLTIPSLAAGGRPRFAAKILERLLDLKADGSLRLDLGYFGFGEGLEPTNTRFWALFGRPPRLPESPCDVFAADVAASLQAVTVEALRRMVREARSVAGCEDVCLAGDATRNEAALEELRASLGGRIRAGGPPPPLAAAVGAACAAWEGVTGRGRPALPPGAWAWPDAAPAVAPRASARAALRALSRPAGRAALAAAYFGALTPASLLARTLGFEPLAERWRARGSYWTKSPAARPR